MNLGRTVEVVVCFTVHFILAISHSLRISDIVLGPFVFISLSLESGPFVSRSGLSLYPGLELLRSWSDCVWDQCLPCNCD